MVLTALLLILVGLSFAYTGVARLFDALAIDPLEMLLFFGIAETVEERGERLVPLDGLERSEARLPRARYGTGDARARSAA